MQTKNELFGPSVQGSNATLGLTPSLAMAREVMMFAVPHNPDHSGRHLSKREQDVLHWLTQGKSGQETSMILGISLCTVRVHIRNMLKKLDASNIPHAVARAFQKGILHK